MKAFLRRLHWIVSQQLGIDLVRLLRFAVAVPWYLADRFRFRRTYVGEMGWVPCLHDKREQSGAISTEYFAQDLFVAQKVFAAGPRVHLDIGSRIDGFVAHVATFRPVTVVDIRPNAARIPNITFLQADLMSPPDSMKESYDSVSCLHTLEHFGLGRYGDPIDPLGYIAGLRNMAHLIAPSGVFYLSVPVGRERVEFNAHRVFHPQSIIEAALGSDLALEAIRFVTHKGLHADWDGSPEHLDSIGQSDYHLGIFTFHKRTPDPTND
jgi:hypothetical protein